MPGVAVLDGLALGDDIDPLAAVPEVVALADAPGALALPPTPGVAAALALPGRVAEALADAPGVVLEIAPLDADVPARPETCAAACWLHVSKSACVCAVAAAALSARTTANGIARVKVAMAGGPPGAP